jgi:hypothetical protein
LNKPTNISIDPSFYEIIVCVAIEVNDLTKNIEEVSAVVGNYKNGEIKTTFYRKIDESLYRVEDAFFDLSDICNSYGLPDNLYFYSYGHNTIKQITKQLEKSGSFYFSREFTDVKMLTRHVLMASDRVLPAKLEDVVKSLGMKYISKNREVSQTSLNTFRLMCRLNYLLGGLL